MLIKCHRFQTQKPNKGDGIRGSFGTPGRGLPQTVCRWGVGGLSLNQRTRAFRANTEAAAFALLRGRGPRGEGTAPPPHSPRGPQAAPPPLHVRNPPAPASGRPAPPAVCAPAFCSLSRRSPIRRAGPQRQANPETLWGHCPRASVLPKGRQPAFRMRRKDREAAPVQLERDEGPRKGK